MFGIPLDSWNNLTLLFLAIAAGAAVALGIAQYAVIRLQKEQARIATEEFKKYKLDSAGELAKANEQAAAANSKAAGSMAMAADAQKGAAALRVRAAEAELKLEELRNRIAPRALTQDQQHDLTAKLSGFKNIRGTVIASPSTPESEWFARILTAPLKGAGWEITILPGTAEATILQPQGVVIQYPLEQHDTSLEMPNPGPSATLAEALNDLGIEATAIPGMVPAPDNIAVIISAK